MWNLFRKMKSLRLHVLNKVTKDTLHFQGFLNLFVDIIVKAFFSALALAITQVAYSPIATNVCSDTSLAISEGYLS